MNKARPFIVTFLGDITIFSAFIGIMSLFPDFTQQFGVYIGSIPIFSGSTMRVVYPLILIIAALGYLKMRRWGYWLMLISYIFILVISIMSILQSELQSSYLGILSTIISLIFIFPTKSYFDKKISSS